MTNVPTHRDSRPSAAAVAAIMVAVLLFEWWLFESSIRDYLLGTYPRHHDQTGYLNLAYLNYERIQSNGAARALWQRLSEPKPQGSLLDFEAALAFMWVEPNRLGALSVIFAHFAVLQVAVLYAAASVTRSLSFGLIAVALVASSGFLFIVPGGWFDFRIDAAANCTYGIFVAAMVCSRFYRDTAWSIATGAIGGYLIALRHNMVVHLAVLHGVFLPMVLLADRRQQSNRGLLGQGTRSRGFAASVAAMTAVGGPFLAVDFTAMANYYLGQFAVRAPVRNALSGRNTIKHLFFYPYAILYHHTRFLLILWSAVAVALWSYRHRLGAGGAPDIGPVASRRSLLARYLPLIASTAVPVTILTLHSDRSPVVIGLTLTPITLAATFTLRDLIDQTGSRPAGWIHSRALNTVAIAALIAALALHGLQHSMWRSDERELGDEASGAYEMHYEVARLLYALGHRSPIYLPSTMAEPLEPGVAATPLFERDRKLLLPTMPAQRQQIFPVAEKRFWQLLPSTDAVMLQTHGAAIEFPFTKFMRSIEPRLSAELREHFVALDEWSFGDFAVAPYLRPKLRLTPGVNLEIRPPFGEEIASFVVSLPSVMLETRPILILEGGRSRGDDALKIAATTGGQSLESAIAISARDVRIAIDFSDRPIAANRMIEVEVTISPSEAKVDPPRLARFPQSGRFETHPYDVSPSSS